MPKKLERILKKFIRLSYKMKLVIVFSFFLSGIIRFLILIIPFRRLSGIMGKEMIESPKTLDPISQARAFKVGWAINTVCNHTPWESKCLVRALTALIILKALHIPSTLYLGVSRNNSSQLAAHAWLRSGEIILTGENEKDSFKCITYFSPLFNSCPDTVIKEKSSDS